MSTEQDVLEESDLQLIEALQLSPRASWTLLGEVLDRLPTVLAARWQRLQTSGAAWISSHPVGRPGQMTLSFHDIQCDPAQRAEVEQALIALPDIFTVERCRRSRDMMLTVITPSLQWLTESVYPQLDLIPGLQRNESSFCTRLHSRANDWRLGVLEARQVRALQPPAPAAVSSGPRPSHFAPIMRELARDGRASAAQIAAAAGMNPATARRQLRRILDSGEVTVRCEVFHRAAGFPVICQWFGRLPAAEHDRAAAALQSLGTLRLCTSLTGAANFGFMMWLRSPVEIMAVEQRAAALVPELELLESMVITEIPKRMGRRLTADGRQTGEVVLPGVAWG